MGAFIHELFQVGHYKRSQGRVTRRVTSAVLVGAFLIAAWRLMVWTEDQEMWVHYGVPILLVVVGSWISFRVINLPQFADFLIAVEAEMNKVSWPSWDELVRSSTVVIFVIFFLAFILFGFDLLWKFIFKLIGVLG